ncbi:hypothetical protein [Mycobacterium sp. 29Ha]|uniref:hypothetical protein n=1 Tax=Mycobacterium sp. 29Ha TaxID=2939268 RepID=UPI002938F10A|nr:hypothetical protein [Mycobacterium sp. 29Ha]MDV3134112.1 hypothetical protein [Mycobacterium sp. 29Ha]
MEFSRLARSWPDRRLWAARVFALRATILGLIDQYPWAAGMIAVPLTIIGLAGVVTLPLLFVPLLVLTGVVLVVIEYYADQQKPGVYQEQTAGGGPTRWNLRSRMGQFRLHGSSKWPQMIREARARAEAVAAESLASAARALAADARKQADVAEARTRANQLHVETQTETKPTLPAD